MERLTSFINFISKYPPSELYGSIENPTPKQKKAEKRDVDVCEELYRLTFPEGTDNVLSNLRVAYRDFEVLYKLGYDSLIKKEVYSNALNELSNAFGAAIPVLDSTFKKSQSLNEYYLKNRLAMKDIKAIVYKLDSAYVEYKK